MVTELLINSMEPIIRKTFMFLPTAHNTWAVRETYSDMENYSQLYELNTRMCWMQQGNEDVTAYYNELMVVWQELDLLEVDEWKSNKDSAWYQKAKEHSRVFVFLAGLNICLDDVQGHILGRNPLLGISEVFSEVRSEEARRQVMMKRDEHNQDAEGSALVSRENFFEAENRDGKSKQWGEKCKELWHIIETCWRIHGKKAHLKKKSGNYNRTSAHGRALKQVVMNLERNLPP